MEDTTDKKLIYGLDTQERIVNIESGDGETEIFYLDDDKNLQSKFVKSSYWLLSSEKLRPNAIRLEGELHYKWAMTYTDRKSYLSDKGKLKSKDTYSIFNPKENHMVRYGRTYYKGLRANDISVLAFDIETTGLDPEANDSKVLIIANTFRDRHGNITRKQFAYDEFHDDREMFESWCEWVRQVDPDVLTGHNINCYDFPYLFSLAAKNRTSLALGRDGSNIHKDVWKSKFRKDQAQTIDYEKFSIYGRDIVDTLFMAVRYDVVAKKYESLNLKKIIETEGLQVKDRVFYEANRIKLVYKNKEEWTKIKAYAEHDGDDALSLFDLYIPNYFYATQAYPRPLQLMVESASGGQINSMMVRSYLQERHSIPRGDSTVEFEGAISFGNTGIYRNVYKIDVSSLYPSVMIQYNIHPYNKDPNCNFQKILNYFRTERLNNKRLAKETGDRYYNDLQESQKITINSSYGFLSTTGLNFNCPQGAADTTRRGRDVLNLSKDWAESKGFIIANADTDSISFCYKDFDEKIKSEQRQLIDEVNGLLPQAVKFEPDGFFPFFCVLKAKNYIMVDEKGKLKKKGSSLKDSKTSVALKEMVDRIIQAIVSDEIDSVESIYHQYVKEVHDIKDIKRWASKKSISQKVLSSERANESKVRDAIEDSDTVEGDKVYMFYKSDETLCMVDNFDGDYHKDRLLENLYKKLQLFVEVIDISKLLNYKLKRNQEALSLLLGIPYVGKKKKVKETEEEQLSFLLE